MTTSSEPPNEDGLTELRARADALELQLSQVRKETENQLIRAELKAEAIRAGMIDLDGIKLLDLSSLRLNDRGEVDGASALMAQFRQDKPWLFGGASSSSPAAPPPVQPSGGKSAMQMTDAEYRVARAEFLKRRF